MVRRIAGEWHEPPRWARAPARVVRLLEAVGSDASGWSVEYVTDEPGGGAMLEKRDFPTTAEAQNYIQERWGATSYQGPLRKNRKDENEMEDTYTYSQAARAVVKTYWTTRTALEAKMKTLKSQLDGGIIGATYYDEQARVLRDALAAERDVAEARLADLSGAFSASVGRWATPDGAKLDDPDTALLDGRYPLSLSEFRALSEKHRGDYTMAQLLRGYAEKKAAAGGENWTPYAATVTPGADERKAAFQTVLDRARADLAAEDAGHVVATMPAKADGLPDAWERTTEAARSTMGELDAMPQG